MLDMPRRHALADQMDAWVGQGVRDGVTEAERIEGEAARRGERPAEFVARAQDRYLDGDRDRDPSTDEVGRALRLALDAAEAARAITTVTVTPDGHHVVELDDDSNLGRRVTESARLASQDVGTWIAHALTADAARRGVPATAEGFPDRESYADAIAARLEAHRAQASVVYKPGDVVRIPEGDTEVELRIDDGAHGPLWIPTVTLRRFSARARETGEELALTDADMDTLDPAGRHVVHGARIQQGAGRDGKLHHFVRTRLTMRRRGQTPEPWSREVDLPLREFGLLLEPLATRTTPFADALRAMRSNGMKVAKAPTWIGARSYQRVFDQAAASAAWPIIRQAYQEGNWPLDAETWNDVKHRALSPVAFLAADTSVRLLEAQVLSVAVEVFEGAPEWESAAEAWTFAQACQPPFDPLYLDLTGPGGLCPLVTIPGGPHGIERPPYRLHGALIYRDGDDGPLTVVPFGWPIEDQDEGKGTAAEYSATGRIVFGGPTPESDIEDRRLTPTDATQKVSSVVSVIRPATLFNAASPESYPGRVEVPSTVYPNTEPAVSDEREVRGWASLTVLAAGRALAVLSMLEAINIEMADLSPTKEEKRLVKRSEKRGWPLKFAPTVVVRPSTYDGRRAKPTGTTREYAAAFWRRGHYAWYPVGGSRIADKFAEEFPAKLATHPTKGVCRKVFRSPTVVGARGADGEYRQPIRKTRVWRQAG